MFKQCIRKLATCATKSVEDDSLHSAWSVCPVIYVFIIVIKINSFTTIMSGIILQIEQQSEISFPKKHKLERIGLDNIKAAKK